MSRKRIDIPPLTDRPIIRRISQKSVDELNQTLHQRINSMVGLDEQLSSKLKSLQQSQITPKDISSIGLSLQDMVNTLQKVSYNEIMYNQLLRENEKLKSEQSYLKSQLIKITSLNTKLQKENVNMIEKLKLHELDVINLTKKYQQEQKLNEDLSKKLKRSEQRVQIILESNIVLQKDQLKNNLMEALSENEHIKKDAIQKQKDFQKLQMTNVQLNQKLQRLNNRFQILGKPQNENEFIDQDKMVITFTEVPKNFVFRHVFQNQECKQFISQALEFSPEDFVQHIISQNNENRKMQLTWLFNYMVNYREFSLTHNYFIIKLSQLCQINTINEIYDFVQNLSSFFKVSRIYLWIRDYWTGWFICQTNEKQMKIMCTKGAFRDSLESREAVNKLTAHKQLMYQNENGEDQYQDNTYIFPILTEASLPSCIIEFQHPTQSNNYNDIQYFSSILGLYVKIALQRIEHEQEIQSIISQQKLLQNEFLQLMLCNDKQTFSLQIKQMQSKILQISSCELIFVEHNKLWKYFNHEIKSLDSLTCVCGQIAISKLPGFFTNISKEVHYNQIIDMYSIAPIYIYPIIHNNQTIAIIQLSLTNKQINKYKFKDPLISLQQQSNQARLFCDCVSTAYIIRFQ